MNKSVSSGLTFFYKVIFPTVWIGGFGSGSLMLFKNNSPEKWTFLFALIIGNLFLSIRFKLKSVRIENENLVISNYFKKIRVPFTNGDIVNSCV